MKELGEGTPRHHRRSQMGWDINPRVLGIGAEGGEGRTPSKGFHLGHRRPLPVRPEGRRRTRSSR